MHYIKLDHDFEVEVVDGMIKTTESLEKEVNRIWSKEAESRDIFNGSIFHLESYNNKVLRGYFVEYRYFLAHRRNPEISIKVTPLGVSGIVTSANSVLMGKRAEHLFSHRGEYEFVPSGSIDKEVLKNKKVNVVEKLLQEFEEETELSRDIIKKRDLLGLFISDEPQVYDIAYVLELKEKAEIEKTQEYSEFSWIPFDKVESFCISNPVVPLSQIIFSKFTKLFRS